MRTSKDHKSARADKNGYYAQCSTTNLADGDSPRNTDWGQAPSRFRMSNVAGNDGQ